MIQITENAANQIQKMLIKRALGETGLRIGVKAGGCSGFEYIFRWSNLPRTRTLSVRALRARRCSSIPRASGCSKALSSTTTRACSVRGSSSTTRTRRAPAAAVCRSAYRQRESIVSTSTQTIEELANREYRYGFVTDVEQ